MFTFHHNVFLHRKTFFKLDTLLVIRAHEAKGVFYWFGNNLLNLALKRNTEDESEFHSLAVRIMKNEAKPFVRTDGTLFIQKRRRSPRLEVRC